MMNGHFYASRESIYAPSHDDVQALEKYTKIDIDVKWSNGKYVIQNK